MVGCLTNFISPGDKTYIERRQLMLAIDAVEWWWKERRLCFLIIRH